MFSIIICCTLSFVFGDFNIIKAQENNVFVENIFEEITPEEEMVVIGNELNMDVYAFQTKKEVESPKSYSGSGEIVRRFEVETNYYFVSRNVANGYMYKSDSTAIVSAGARLNVNITYDYYTKNGFEYGKLISTSGSVTNFNSGCRFVQSTVNYGSSGPQYPGQAVSTISYSSTWSYSAPSSWGYNILGSGWTSIGSTVTAYITRDGSNIYSGSLGVKVS